MGPKNKHPISQEERALFLAAVDGGSDSPITETKEVKPSDAQMFLDALDRVPTQFIKDKPTEKKARPRQDNTIEAQLDLHGQTRERAKARLDIFLDRCRALGKRRLLIIHGKGSGILKDEVRAMLRGDARVAEATPAPRELGGDGATVILLRKQRSERA